MIDALFQFGGDLVLVRIKGNEITFGNTQFGNQMADISGLKLDYGGVCREFPDLETKENWKEEAIKRFKEKIKSFKTEKQKIGYIKEELLAHGYKPLKMQRKGFRHEPL